MAKEIVAAGASYGSSDEFRGEKINLEFVSANPTGPHPHRRCPLGGRG